MNVYLDDEVEDLIIKKINNSITEEELDFLLSWLSSNNDNLSIFDEYLKVKDYFKNAKKDFVPDYDKALFNIKKKRKRRRILFALKCASVFILPFFIIFHYVNNYNQIDLITNQVVDVIPKQIVLENNIGDRFYLSQNNDTILYVSKGLENEKDEVSDKIIINNIKVPRGLEYNLELSDGTRVWINSSSSLIYPESFEDGERKVKLTGEAYFDVAKSEQAFIVETDIMDVLVLGTCFNVSCYEDEDMVHATVVNGKVKVVVDSDKSWEINPGEQVFYENEKWLVRDVDINLYTSWMTGVYIFYNEELEDICRHVSRWFDKDVVFLNEELKSIHLTGAIIKENSLSEFIEMVEGTSKVRFEVGEKEITVRKR